MRHWLWSTVLLLASCSGWGDPSPEAWSPASRSEAELDLPRALSLHLSLVERMLSSGRPFAALAHLDALSSQQGRAAGARWLRAEALRQIGSLDEARRAYEQLSGEGEYSGLAQRGLGLLAASEGQLDLAVAHLRRARDLLPTDARIRNDLGYAELLRGMLSESEHELRTAIELAPSDGRAARNLLLLLFVRGLEREAVEWSQARAFDSSTVERIRARAAMLAGMRVDPSQLGSLADAVPPAHAPLQTTVDPCARAQPWELLEPGRWLGVQRSGECAGSAPSVPSAAGALIYRGYLSTYPAAAGNRDPEIDRDTGGYHSRSRRGDR